MRIAVQGVAWQADLIDQIGGAGSTLAAVANTLNQQGLGDDGRHRHARIQRSERVLENDLDGALRRPCRGFVKQLPAKAHRAGGRPLQPGDDVPNLLLPLPLSPTSARVSPGSMCRLTPSTAVRVRRPAGNRTRIASSATTGSDDIIGVP